MCISLTGTFHKEYPTESEYWQKNKVDHLGAPSLSPVRVGGFICVYVCVSTEGG